MSGEAPRDNGDDPSKKPDDLRHEETKEEGKAEEENKRELPFEDKATDTASHGSQDSRKMTFASIWKTTPAQPAVDEDQLQFEEFEQGSARGSDFKADERTMFRVWFMYKQVRATETKPTLKPGERKCITWSVFSTEFAKRHQQDGIKNKIEFFEY